MLTWQPSRYPVVYRLAMLLGCLATLACALTMLAWSHGNVPACGAHPCAAAVASVEYLVGGLLAILFALGCCALLSLVCRPLMHCAGTARRLLHKYCADEADDGAKDELSSTLRCMALLARRLDACTEERDRLQRQAREQDRFVASSFDIIHRACAGVTQHGAGAEWLSALLSELILYNDGSSCSVWLFDSVALQTNLPHLVNAGKRDIDLRRCSLKELAARPGLQQVFPEEGGGLRLAVALRDAEDTYGLLLVECAPGDDQRWRRYHLLESVAGLLSLSIGSLLRSRRRRRLALIDERNAIAGELHDSLAQTLSFVKIQMSMLHRELSRHPEVQESTGAICGEMRTGLDTAYRHLRELLTEFRTNMPTGGLRQALQEALDELAARAPIDIQLNYRLEEASLSVHQEFNVLQIVREAVTNTIRHARAARLFVSLYVDDDGQGHVEVQDDGQGLGAPARDGHYGLSIMRERAARLDGILTVGARLDGIRGTCLSLRFPLESPAFDTRKN